MATKKKAAKRKATKKKAAKRKATKKKATKRKGAKKKKATKNNPKKVLSIGEVRAASDAARARVKKKADVPEWVKELKRAVRFRELSNKQIAIYCGYQGSGAGVLLRMKGTGKDPLQYKISPAELKKYFKPIASRKPEASAAKKSNGNGASTARERSILAWLLKK